MSTYELKQNLPQAAQKKVVTLVLGYTIVGNATPANAVITVEDPGVLLLETESTSASGGSDLSAVITSGETLTPADASDDSDGEYNGLVRIGEKIKKVVSLQVRDRDTGAVIPCKFMTAPSDGIISEATAGADDMIAVGFDHGADLTAATVDAVLEVKFILD